MRGKKRKLAIQVRAQSIELLWGFLCEHARRGNRRKRWKWSTPEGGWPPGEPACQCCLCSKARRHLGLKMRPTDHFRYVQRIKPTYDDQLLVRWMLPHTGRERLARMLGLHPRAISKIVEGIEFL